MKPEALSAGQLFEELGEPLAEARSHVIVPKRGKLVEEDGSLRVAIIRPCVSRGKKIRGLPPIYTPRMLAENAAVFTDWPMYEDHLAEEALANFQEQLAEARMGDVLEFLQERARRIKELGGRVAKSFWNPDVTFPDDAEYGFQPGAIEGKVFPQPGILRMLEADPEILNVSINAWPSGARPGNAPWDPGQKGMIIEGIRNKPRGSVDWVFRGGAGGRLLIEEEDAAAAVSVLEAFYSARDGQGPLAGDEDVTLKLKDLKPSELREYLQEEAPHLVEALAPESGDGAGKDGAAPLTEERAAELLRQQREEFEAKLAEREAEVQERAEEILAERRAEEKLELRAHQLLEEAGRNGLPPTWVANLKRRYAAGQPSLQLSEEENEDGEKLSPEKVLEQRIREDIAECVKLMEEAGARPRIRGISPGGASGEKNGDGTGSRNAPAKSAFRDFLRESGDLSPQERDGKNLSEDDLLGEMIQEGVTR